MVGGIRPERAGTARLGGGRCAATAGAERIGTRAVSADSLAVAAGETSAHPRAADSKLRVIRNLTLEL